MQPINSFEHAIRTDNLSRHYGSGKKIVNVLNSITMTVPRGKIYGLLGASGSGKTTLLKCITGQLHVHGGSLEVLGKPPLTKDHPVPGPAIGYMPQEIALYAEFTVAESLAFFGKLHKMTKTELNERQHHLLELLELSGFEQRLIRQLSGGQQRRVSLAIALLNRPQLLILDEPTVGVDAMLRAKLWHYFLELVQVEDVTILITTHYIEEARQADIVALMRDGRLLAEDSPAALLAFYRRPTLEDVFLELCRRNPTQEEVEEPIIAMTAVTKRKEEYAPLLDETDTDTALPVVRAAVDATTSESGNDPTKKTKKTKISRFERPEIPRWNNVKTMAWKNLVRLSRNYSLLAFEFLLPSIQIILFCIAIGATPRGLKMATCNLDNNAIFHLGQNVLDGIDNKTINQVVVSSLEEGINKVRSGECWGVIFMNSTFSVETLSRLTNGDDSSIIGSQVQLYMDNSNAEITVTIEQAVLQGYSVMVNGLLALRGAPAEFATLPVFTNTPIYGELNPTFTHFVAPGMMVSLMFAQSIGLACLALVMDRREGLISRMWAAGVRPLEVIAAHFITQLGIILIQSGLMMMFALAAFKLPMVGNAALALFFQWLMGLCGMMWGIFLSTRVADETEAVQAALGTFFPVLLLSGVIWPIQGIPIPLRWLSYAFPTAWGADAMRSIMLRGWDINTEPVWSGILVVFGWASLFFALSALSIRRVE